MLLSYMRFPFSLDVSDCKQCYIIILDDFVFCLFYNVPVGEFEKKKRTRNANYKYEIRRTNGQNGEKGWNGNC